MLGIRGVVLSIGVVMSTAAVAAPTGLNEACRKIFKTYESKAGPKAFASSAEGPCGWASRKKKTDAEYDSAKTRAIGFCVANGGADCRVVDSER